MPSEPLGLMACKVIMRAPISSAAKAVGAILLDHVNWKAGCNYRCDPGIDRLVRLSGHSRSTVQSGLRQLADVGFVESLVHASRSGRNRYEFCWPLIRDLDAEMQEALRSGRCPTRNQGLGSPDNRAQTRIHIPKKEPVGQARCEIPRTGSSCPSSHQSSQTRGHAANQAAVRRWNEDLYERFASDLDTYAELVDRIDGTLRDDATISEMKTPGSGVDLIVQRLRAVGGWPCRE